MELALPHPPLPPLLLLEPLDVQLGSAQHVRHLGLHGHGGGGGAGWVARGRAERGGRERGTGGNPGQLPSQRLVHGLALKKLGSDRIGRKRQRKKKITKTINSINLFMF